MYIIFFLVAFAASIIGKICGMGGGVIIKPVLDALNVVSVPAVNFLSGCTVIGMSAWSVFKNVTSRQKSVINWKISTWITLAAACGGPIGKILFQRAASLFKDADTAGGVQAICMFIAIALTLIYTLNEHRIRTFHVTNPVLCALIGLFLGAFCAFLGIGGGPFYMVILTLFFSMDSKVAAQNSLYIILISQTTAIIKTIATDGVPDISAWLILGMIVFGVLGSETGRRINRKLSIGAVEKLFACVMVVIMCISAYNIHQFF